MLVRAIDRARVPAYHANPDALTARERDHTPCDQRYQRDDGMAPTVGGELAPSAGVPECASRAFGMRGSSTAVGRYLVAV